MKHQIATVLHTDHELMTQIARELRACTQPALAHLKFKQLSAVLGGHLAALKKVVYPGLKSLGWPEVSSELLVVQAQLTHVFAEVLTLKSESAALSDALSDVLEVMQRMVDAERRSLLPVLSRHLDPVQQLTLGVEAQRYLSHPSEHERLDSRIPLGEWMEEARIVLGGLHAARRGP